MIESAVYQKYKPLRNFLRRLDTENALYVIWAYTNLLQFDKALPPDVRADPAFLTKRKDPDRGLYEWELALLAREVIANARVRPRTSAIDLRNWSNLANAVNKLKAFENDVWPLHGGGHNILTELRRITHRQFPWQSRPNTSSLLRYFKIYSHPDLDEIVEGQLGLPIQKWYFIGFALFGVLLSHPSTTIAPDIQINGLSKADFDAFVSMTKIDLESLQQLIDQEVQFDDQFVYTLNPLEYYPLIEIGEHYHCPIINFLVWRITSGLFFYLIKDKRFGHPFGLAFQQYHEEVATVMLDGAAIAVIPEQPYHVGRNKKDSVDLILADDAAALFVEAKAKRMQVRSKSQLVSNEAIERDISKLATDVVQAYKTISDYRENQYAHFPRRNGVAIYPFVVTLENWYLLGEDLKRLKTAVQHGLERVNLPISFVEEMPFTVCSSDTFEYFVQIIHKHGIQTVMDKWHRPELEGHEFGQHIRTTYTGEFSQLTEFFPREAKMIFPV